jgi:hypothetical protein
MANIAGNVKTLIADIRAHVRAQRDLWRQVPLAALEADGRTGFNDNYSRAYYHGHWALDASLGVGGVRGYTAYIDLASGELVNAYDPKRKAPDDAVLALALTMDDLDASKILAFLAQAAQSKISPGYPPTHEQDLQERIAKLRKDLRLDARFD